MNNIYIKSIFLLILIYVGITVVIYFYQRKLLYHPFNTQVSGEGLIHNFETINFKTSDNLLLKGWFHLKSSKKKTILFLHGNAGNLDNRIDKLNSIGNMDVNFLIIAWRGYSGNPGKPSEEGLYKDARGSIKWLNEKGLSCSTLQHEADTCPNLGFGSFAFGSFTKYDPSGMLVFLSKGTTPTIFSLSGLTKAALLKDLFPIKSFFLLTSPSKELS